VGINSKHVGGGKRQLSLAGRDCDLHQQPMKPNAGTQNTDSWETMIDYHPKGHQQSLLEPPYLETTLLPFTEVPHLITHLQVNRQVAITGITALGKNNRPSKTVIVNISVQNMFFTSTSIPRSR
jgi:hypothetical protein